MVKKQSILCKSHFIINIFFYFYYACVMCVTSARPMAFNGARSESTLFVHASFSEYLD